eukprot:TRINITY_DN13218_c0_g2_i1.p1 TRINITY_DN13218_c0_g2~~TRINITY_DN13218_c0_g2_i1.p1  ORF type:complete len:1356 (+),score=231.40 TRINITY_DN13218_c0_g2_i1:53-4069(+)
MLQPRRRFSAYAALEDEAPPPFIAKGMFRIAVRAIQVILRLRSLAFRKTSSLRMQRGRRQLELRNSAATHKSRFEAEFFSNALNSSPLMCKVAELLTKFFEQTSDNTVLETAVSMVHQVKCFTLRICWSEFMEPMRQSVIKHEEEHKSLKGQFQEARLAYMKELSILRDQARCRADPLKETPIDPMIFWDPHQMATPEEKTFLSRAVMEIVKTLFDSNPNVSENMAAERIMKLKEQAESAEVEALKKQLLDTRAKLYAVQQEVADTQEKESQKRIAERWAKLRHARKAEAVSTKVEVLEEPAVPSAEEELSRAQTEIKELKVSNNELELKLEDLQFTSDHQQKKLTGNVQALEEQLQDMALGSEGLREALRIEQDKTSRLSKREASLSAEIIGLRAQIGMLQDTQGVLQMVLSKLPDSLNVRQMVRRHLTVLHSRPQAHGSSSERLVEAGSGVNTPQVPPRRASLMSFHMDGAPHCSNISPVRAHRASLMSTIDPNPNVAQGSSFSPVRARRASLMSNMGADLNVPGAQGSNISPARARRASLMPNMDSNLHVAVAQGSSVSPVRARRASIVSNMESDLRIDAEQVSIFSAEQSLQSMLASDMHVVAQESNFSTVRARRATLTSNVIDYAAQDSQVSPTRFRRASLMCSSSSDEQPPVPQGLNFSPVRARRQTMIPSTYCDIFADVDEGSVFSPAKARRASLLPNMDSGSCAAAAASSVSGRREMVVPKMYSDLCAPAAQGDIDHLRQMLARKHVLDVNQPNYDRRTALHVAASQGFLETVVSLVEEMGASVNPVDAWGGRPLDDAMRAENYEIIEYLKSQGAECGTSASAPRLPELERRLREQEEHRLCVENLLQQHLQETVVQTCADSMDDANRLDEYSKVLRAEATVSHPDQIESLNNRSEVSYKELEEELRSFQDEPNLLDALERDQVKRIFEMKQVLAAVSHQRRCAQAKVLLDNAESAGGAHGLVTERTSTCSSCEKLQGELAATRALLNEVQRFAKELAAKYKHSSQENFMNSMEVGNLRSAVSSVAKRLSESEALRNKGKQQNELTTCVQTLEQAHKQTTWSRLFEGGDERAKARREKKMKKLMEDLQAPCTSSVQVTKTRGVTSYYADKAPKTYGGSPLPTPLSTHEVQSQTYEISTYVVNEPRRSPRERSLTPRLSEQDVHAKTYEISTHFVDGPSNSSSRDVSPQPLSLQPPLPSLLHNRSISSDKIAGGRFGSKESTGSNVPSASTRRQHSDGHRSQRRRLMVPGMVECLSGAPLRPAHSGEKSPTQQRGLTALASPDVPSPTHSDKSLAQPDVPRLTMRGTRVGELQAAGFGDSSAGTLPSLSKR